MRRLAETLTFLAALVGLSGVGSYAHAAQRFAVANTAWNLTSTWSATSGGAAGASVPVAGDDVFIGDIAAARAVTIPAGYAAAATSVTLGTTAGVANAKTLTLSANTASLTVSGNLTVNKPTNAVSNLLNVNAGTVTVNGNVTLGGTAATATFISGIVITTGTLNVDGNLVFTSGVAGNNLINFSASSGTVNLKGAFTATVGTFSNPGTSTFNYNGTTAAGQTVRIGTSSIIYQNLHLNNTGTAGATLNAAISATNVLGNVRVQTGILNNGGFAMVGSAGGTFQVADGARFNLTGTSVIPTGFGTRTFGTTVGNMSTVSFQGGNQTIAAGLTYGNLILDGAAASTKTMGTAAAQTITVAGNFTVQGTTTTYAGNTFNPAVNLAGDFTNSATTFNSGTGIYTFNLAGAQQITGTTSFVNLAVNKSGNTLTLNNNVTATVSLNLQAGTVTTGGNTLILAPAVAANGCSFAGALSRTTGYVIGNLQYKFAAGASTCIFHIGDATAYTPVTVAMRGASATPANNLITTRMDTPDHAGVTSGAAGIDPIKSVNRYWTLTGGPAWVFGTTTQYDATFTFQGVGTDADTGSNTANYEVSRFTGGSWFGTAPGTRTATTTQALEQDAFGEFAIGELVNVVYAEYRMEDAAGLLGALADTSGNNRNGVRVGAANTATPSPVKVCQGLTIPNNTTPLTNRDAGDTQVNLNQVSERGSITFWYKGNAAWNSGAVKQLLDASSTATAVFALQLTATGLLRFDISDTAGVSRTITQTVTSGIAANTWAHVAVTWDFTVPTMLIYVNGAAVGTGAAGATNGAMATLSTLYIGDNRNTGVAPPNNPNGISANGVFDEVRIYRGVRSLAQIGVDMNATFSCAGGATIAGRFNAFETTTGGTATTGVIKTKISGTSTTVAVAAINEIHGAVNTLFTGTVKIELLNATDDGGTLDANRCRSSWSTINTAGTLTFAGGDLGRKNFSFTESDAYRNLRLRISYPSTGTPVLIGCTTDNFAMRPNSLQSIVAQDETWETAYTTGTPRTLDNSGIVHKAGRPFTISATALNGAGSPAATPGYDGTPTVVSGSTVLLSPSPASTECTGGNPACSPGTLNPGTWATAGSGIVRTTTASYTEVGVFRVQFEDQTWASVDASDSTTGELYVPASANVTIGRFVPNHFLVASSQAPVFQTFGADDTTCTAPSSGSKRRFTYIGQSFNWQTRPRVLVTAERFGGGTTMLYRGTVADGGLFRIATGGVIYTHSGGTGFTATPHAAGIVFVDNHNGTAFITASASDAFSYGRTTPQVAFNAAISMTMNAQDTSESDGAISSTTAITFNGGGGGIAFDGGDFSATLTGGKTFVFGRLRLANANGSQLVPLPVQLVTDYWVEPSPGKSFFAFNTADHCTTLAGANFMLSNPQGTGFAVAPTCTTSVSSAAITFNGGRGNLVLTKPAGGLVGSVDLAANLGTTAAGNTCVGGASVAHSFANKTFLQGTWSSGGNYDQNPTARARFGVYQGSEEVIHRRENF
jgi:MSHA biogenesis protein MshQ